MECDRCGSTHFQIDNGIRYCENGHEQEGGQQIGEDEGDYGTQGKIIRKVKEPPRERASRVYRGKKAYRLFLQAYQFLIWNQCHTLIHQKGLPPELWTVVRDLWTLRLSQLLDRFDDGGLVPTSASQSSSRGVESVSESEGDGLLKSKVKAGDAPVLLQTICLCYVGILLLRQPVSLGTVFTWTKEEDIPYFRAIRHVPNEMTAKLPGEYCDALDTSSLLTREELQQGVYQLCNLYEKRFGMSTSPINWEVLLFESIKKLALPLDVYPAVKHLNKIVKYDFSYLNLSPIRRKIISYPEAQLMALVVVAVKILYPFDSATVQRYLHSSYEPAAIGIDWEVWLESRKSGQHDRNPGLDLKKGAAIEVKDTDIFDMSLPQLDQYMDWYQKTWITSRTMEDDVSKEILDMFPLKNDLGKARAVGTDIQKEDAAFELVKANQTHSKPWPVVTEEEAAELDQEVTRPGMQYQQFRTGDALQAQPAAYAFHEAAAETACLSLDGLLRAVLQTERKITLWKTAKRRAEFFGEEMDVEAEAGVMHRLQGLERMQLYDKAERPVDLMQAEDIGHDETLDVDMN